MKPRSLRDFTPGIIVPQSSKRSLVADNVGSGNLDGMVKFHSVLATALSDRSGDDEQPCYLVTGFFVDFVESIVMK